MKNPSQVERARHEGVAAAHPGHEEAHHEDKEKKSGLLSGLLHKHDDKGKAAEEPLYADESKQSILQQNQEFREQKVSSSH